MPKEYLCQSQEYLFCLSSHSTTFYSNCLPHSEPGSPCLPYSITWEAIQSSPTPKTLEKVENVSRTDPNFQHKVLCILLLAVFLALLFYYELSAGGGACTSRQIQTW